MVTFHIQSIQSGTISCFTYAALTMCVNVALVNLIILVNYYTYPDVDSKHVNILRVCKQLCCYRKHIGTFGMLWG